MFSQIKSLVVQASLNNSISNAQSFGGTHRCVNTHMAHHAADHQLFDGQFIQKRKQIRIEETIRGILDNYLFPGKGRYQGIDIDCLGISDKKKEPLRLC